MGGVGRFFTKALEQSKGFGKQVGGTALGYGIGDAVFWCSRTSRRDTNQGWNRWWTKKNLVVVWVVECHQAATGVSSQCHICIIRCFCSNPVVNQLQDIERVLVDIKGDTAVMALLV